MKANLNQYRFGGIAGGLLWAAGQFWGPACVLQVFAMVPVMFLALRDRRVRFAALAGMEMGVAYAIPQMIYLRMPVTVTVILLVWMTVLLMVLCMSFVTFLPRRPLLGSLAVGAVWYILDWINFTVVPIWGTAQSFARSWTAYPFAIQFISITGISGVLIVVGTLSGLLAHIIFNKYHKNSANITFPAKRYIKAISMLILTVFCIDAAIWFQKPSGSLRIAAAGWVYDDTSSEIDPHKPEGFQQLFAVPASEAAAQGAHVFTSGELGFYIARHEWDERIEEFAEIARANNLWLVVGYFNISDDENRLFFMSPDGEIVHEYTKTYLTPFEPGQKGSGDLQTIEVDGVTIGAMICQDDNFSKLTRHYGNLKANIVLCPTADWWTIKNAHLQAVRARAIECNYGIVRGAACGISAAISPGGTILAKQDHYRSGPGTIIAEVPIRKSKTVFSRFGSAPTLFISGLLIVLGWYYNKQKRPISATSL